MNTLQFKILKSIRKKSDKLSTWKEYCKTSFLFSLEREQEKKQIKIIKKNLIKLCTLYKLNIDNKNLYECFKKTVYHIGTVGTYFPKDIYFYNNDIIFSENKICLFISLTEAYNLLINQFQLIKPISLIFINQKYKITKEYKLVYDYNKYTNKRGYKIYNISGKVICKNNWRIS